MWCGGPTPTPHRAGHATLKLVNEWRAEQLHQSRSRRRSWTPQRSPQSFLLCSGTMSSRCPQRLCRPTVMNGGLSKLEAPRQLSGAEAQPPHPQPLHPQPLHPQHQQQLSCARVQASLSRFTTCTVPASCRARSRFLNLRDSVKKSPTKSTAKVVGGCPTARQQQLPWVPLTGNKVLVTGSGAEDLVNTARGGLRQPVSLWRSWGRVGLGWVGVSWFQPLDPHQLCGLFLRAG